MQNKQIRVLIIGSKNFDDYIYFEEKLYKVLEKYFEEDYEIIIREQEIYNVGTYAVRFAKENNCKLERYKINWDEYGKSAAYVNIKELIYGKEAKSCSDILICFYKRKDKKAERTMTELIKEEFSSVISFDYPYYLPIFIFTKTK